MTTVIRTNLSVAPILPHPDYATFAAMFASRCVSPSSFLPAGHRVAANGLRLELHVWEGDEDLAYVCAYDQFGRKASMYQTTVEEARSQEWADADVAQTRRATHRGNQRAI